MALIMSDPNAQLIQDLLDGWNQHDASKVAALYTPDYEEEDIAAAGKRRSPIAARATMILYLRAFPDLRLEAEDIIIQGNCAAMSWILTGTHKGTLMNIPATGRSVRVRGVSLMTIEGGKLKRTCRVWDLAGLLRAFGLLPELS
jgi:steroid delta-isomerase-like uncharacterized protein